jgi:hypothetical protein
MEKPAGRLQQRLVEPDILHFWLSEGGQVELADGALFSSDALPRN